MNAEDAGTREDEARCRHQQKCMQPHVLVSLVVLAVPCGLWNVNALLVKGVRSS